MRVIAGSAKGMTLLCPKNLPVRPATDRVKESVFGVLSGSLEDACVLDLFAGSGSVGIEALSRGAARCTFVENDARCVKVIRENLERTHLAERAHLMRANALRIAAIVDPRDVPFDLVFVDPPYAQSERMDATSPIGRLLVGIGEGDLLADGGLVVVEHATSSAALGHAGALILDDQRRYGGTTVSFYEKSRNGDGTRGQPEDQANSKPETRNSNEDSSLDNE